MRAPLHVPVDARSSGAARLAPFAVLALAGGLVPCAAALAAERVAVPAAAAAAVAYYAFSNWFWGLDQVCALALPAALLVTGWGARLHGLAARISRRRGLASVAVFAALFFLLDRLARAPIAYGWEQAFERSRGIEGPAPASWAAAHARGAVLLVAGMTLLAVAGYWLIAATRRWWWLWASGAGSVVILGLLLAEPWIPPHRPLDGSPLAGSLAALGARAYVPRAAIVLERCDPASACPPGRVIGLGPTRLMLLDDARLAESPASWTHATVAHEAKHFAMDDNVKAFVLLSALLAAGLGLVHLAGRAIAARWSGPLGFEELGHPASLPLLALLLGAFHVVALPPVNAFRRHVELEADRFALELTRDGETQARMLAALASEKGRVPEWSPFFRAFRATHPSFAERIRLANEYHPWLDGGPLVYGDAIAGPGD
jgi:hypothetical protein